MNEWDHFLRGLVAFGATVFTAWLYVETKRELYRAASKNDLAAIIGLAVAHGAAMQSFHYSIRELQRQLE